MLNSAEKAIKLQKTEIDLDNIGMISVDEEWS